MTPTQRIEAVLAGQQPDRTPISFWHHFPASQFHGAAAVEAHVNHLDAYDLDFLKVMNDNPYPHEGVIATTGDLTSIQPLSGDEEAFQRQLDLIAALRPRVNGRVLMVTTVFNAWTVLRHLIKPPTEHLPPDLSSDDPLSRHIRQFWADDPSATRLALNTIADNLAKFARRCLAAGADGIYLSVRDDWVLSGDAAPDLYADLVRPADLTILNAAASAKFNILHVCGRPLHLNFFNDYPVHAISWADRAAGPSIASAAPWLKPAICAGMDNLNTLRNATPDECVAQALDSIRQAGQRPIILAPGCTYDPNKVPRENLVAVRNAVKQP